VNQLMLIAYVWVESFRRRSACYCKSPRYILILLQGRSKTQTSNCTLRELGAHVNPGSRSVWRTALRPASNKRKGGSLVA
jgi:hypothetical protein